MAEFDDIFNPKQSVESLGQSLLSNAQQNRRRRSGPSNSDVLKFVGARLAGHFVGDYMRSSMDQQLNEHMNKSSELSRRAIYKAAVEDSTNVLEMERAGKQHAAGIRGYLYADMVARNEAQLMTQLGGDAALKSPAHIKQIARELADDAIDERLNQFNSRVEAARKVNQVSGGDTLAYYNEVRKNAAADQSLLAQLARRVTTVFRNRDDEDYDNALYNSATSTRLYQVSEEYRNNFDKTYSETGSALAAAKVSKYLEQNKDTIRDLQLEREHVTLNIDGESQSALLTKGPDGSPIQWQVIATGEVFSAESLGKGRSKKRSLNSKQAETLIGDAFASSDENRQKELTTLFTVPEAVQGTDSEKNIRKRIATNINDAIIGLEDSFLSETITPERREEIAINTILIDKEINGRLLLSNGNERGYNELLLWPATKKAFGGDADDVPPQVTNAVGLEIERAIEGLYLKTTPPRIKELIDIAKNNDLFDDLENDDGTGINVTDLLENQFVLSGYWMKFNADTSFSGSFNDYLKAQQNMPASPNSSGFDVQEYSNNLSKVFGAL